MEWEVRRTKKSQRSHSLSLPNVFLNCKQRTHSLSFSNMQSQKQKQTQKETSLQPPLLLNLSKCIAIIKDSKKDSNNNNNNDSNEETMCDNAKKKECLNMKRNQNVGLSDILINQDTLSIENIYFPKS